MYRSIVLYVSRNCLICIAQLFNLPLLSLIARTFLPPTRALARSFLAQLSHMYRSIVYALLLGLPSILSHTCHPRPHFLPYLHSPSPNTDDNQHQHIAERRPAARLEMVCLLLQLTVPLHSHDSLHCPPRCALTAARAAIVLCRWI